MGSRIFLPAEKKLQTWRTGTPQGELGQLMGLKWDSFKYIFVSIDTRNKDNCKPMPIGTNSLSTFTQILSSMTCKKVGHVREEVGRYVPVLTMHDITYSSNSPHAYPIYNTLRIVPVLPMPT